jgi:hypothetical protein
MLRRVSVAVTLLGCLVTQTIANRHNIVAVGTLSGGASSTAASVDHRGTVAGCTTFSGSSTGTLIRAQTAGGEHGQ